MVTHTYTTLTPNIKLAQIPTISYKYSEKHRHACTPGAGCLKGGPALTHGLKFNPLF